MVNRCGSLFPGFKGNSNDWKVLPNEQQFFEKLRQTVKTKRKIFYVLFLSLLLFFMSAIVFEFYCTLRKNLNLSQNLKCVLL